MTSASLLMFDGVGEIRFVKSRRARSLNMSLEEDRSVRISLPYWVSFRKAREIVLANPDWVKKFVRKMERTLLEQESLTKEVIPLSRKEAERLVLERSKYLIEKYGFRCNRIFVKDQKTRWGSCSSKGNIYLNRKLVCLPEDLMDYVIIHELVHLNVKNHKQEFWDTMNSYIPHAKELDKCLRKYQLAFIKNNW